MIQCVTLPLKIKTKIAGVFLVLTFSEISVMSNIFAMFITVKGGKRSRSQSNSYIMFLPINDRHHYIKKMKEIWVGECPFSPCLSKYTNDPMQWPEVLSSDIYSYLSESPGNVALLLIYCLAGVLAH